MMSSVDAAWTFSISRIWLGKFWLLFLLVEGIETQQQREAFIIS